MTPKAQQIAIAETLGWSHCEVISSRTGFKSLGGYPPNARSTDWVKLPDYLADLNAIHEVEQTLTRDQIPEWERLIRAITLCDAAEGTGLYERIIRATAAQRAEAFLRTIGRWTDDAPTNPPAGQI